MFFVFIGLLKCFLLLLGEYFLYFDIYLSKNNKKYLVDSKIVFLFAYRITINNK